MDIKQIQDLIRFVSKAGVSEVSIEQKDFKITVKTPQTQTIVNATMPAFAPAQAAPAAAPAQPQIATNVEHTPAQTEAPAAADVSKFLTIKSPMIGTYYRSSTPDKPSFVNVGDEIKPGKVLCIVEAMKLFNEIESEISGRIVKVLVENASPVEFDQPLFLVEPM